MQRFYHYLSEKIVSIDIYGSKPQFKIRKDDNFKTGFGSLLTIASIITTILALSYFSLQLFDVTNPKLVISLRNIFNPPHIKLNNTNFGFTFGLQNAFTYDQFIDESIYRAEAYHMTGSRLDDGTFNWTVRKLELETCNINKFPQVYHNIFKDLPFENLYCLKDTSFDLFGTFLNEEYQYIKLLLLECKNSTLPNSTVCKSKSYIDEMLAGTFFSFAHTDLTIDPTNYTNPNQLYAGDSYTTVSNKFFKEMHHYLKIIKFETDKGWLISDINSQDYIQLDFIKEMTDFRKSDSFLSYTIKLSTKLEKYSRSYIKVQNVAADSGGFLKIISMFCLVVSFYYNRTKFYELIGEEIMSEKTKIFPSESEVGLRTLIKSQEIENNLTMKNLNNTTKKNNFFEDGTSSKNITVNRSINQDNKNSTKFLKKSQTIINNKIQKRNVKRFNINLSFCQSFMYYFCTNKKTENKNYRKLNIIRDKTDEMVNIIKIFKDFNDLERLKKIVLDGDQLKLFNLPYFLEIDMNQIQKDDSEDIIGLTKFSDGSTENQHNKLEYSIYFNAVSSKNDDFSKRILGLINY